MARRGFTLIEIMAALAVLVIGLTATLAIFTTSMRLSNNAADRNVTRALIEEAVADIERAHLITADMNQSGAPWNPPPDDVGGFIETVTTPDGVLPTIHHGVYKNVFVGSKSFNEHLLSYCALNCFSGSLNPTTTRTLMWPFGNTPKFIGGPIASGPTDPGSYAYRIIYRLERDPLWHPHNADCADYLIGNENVNSAYAGMYQLTLVVYRDMDRKGGRLEQLTDPVVVTLRDRKVRP